MERLLKKCIQTNIACMCAIVLLGLPIVVGAADIKSMEEKSTDLEKQLSNVDQELLGIGTEIADVETQIGDTIAEIERTRELLAIARNREAEQYEDMKLRIKYMYENGSMSMLEVIVSAENMGDFLNRIDFIQNISEYDRNKLEDLTMLRTTIEEQEKYLVEKQGSQAELQSTLDSKQKSLQAKADAMKIDLAELRRQIQILREEEERKAAEEARRKAEAEAKAKKEAQEAAAQAGKRPASGGNKYDMPSGDGVLTKEKGVNYYKGHRETYYSQKVLPGGGLNIPGRHVASDGTIRDKDNYICVASSDYPKGTVVETSLGPGKVYDTGCAKGTIDLYTDW